VNRAQKRLRLGGGEVGIDAARDMDHAVRPDIQVPGVAAFDEAQRRELEVLPAAACGMFSGSGGFGDSRKSRAAAPGACSRRDRRAMPAPLFCGFTARRWRTGRSRSSTGTPAFSIATTSAALFPMKRCRAAFRSSHRVVKSEFAGMPQLADSGSRAARSPMQRASRSPGARTWMLRSSFASAGWSNAAGLGRQRDRSLPSAQG
jgi:hypothetical protein